MIVAIDGPAASGKGTIARRLFVTEATVKFHVHNILAKTGFRNRAELAAALTEVSSEED